MTLINLSNRMILCKEQKNTHKDSREAEERWKKNLLLGKKHIGINEDE